MLAWHIDGGSWRGEPLAGVDLVALVVAAENLAEKGVARRSVVFVDEHAPAAQREGAVEWLATQHASALGTIAAVEVAPVSVAREGDHYAVRAGDAVELSGSTMPDRACCSMPFNVWYEPFENVPARVVGCSEEFRAASPSLGVRWTRSGQNDAFLGRFAAGAGSPASS